MNSVIIRYSEIGLKSDFVRKEFEKKLVQNLKNMLKKTNTSFDKILRFRSRIIILTKNPEKVLKISLKTFGVENASVSRIINNDLEEIKKECVKILKNFKQVKNNLRKTTFRITTQRINKNYSLTSMEVNNKIGEHVLKNFKNLKVNLLKPDINLGVEILKEKALLFFTKIKGVGGLPVGTQGKVLCLIQNNEKASLKNSLISALIMMRRGCSPDLVSFNKKFDLMFLKEYYPEKINYFLTKKNEIRKLAENYEALITGETIKNVKEWKEFDKKMFVLRPLTVIPRERFEKILLLKN